jgi:hypothetical protein
MTGSKAQLYNGIVLLITFFSCRLVWGTYQSVRVYQDVWAALQHTPAVATVHYNTLANSTAAPHATAVGRSEVPIYDDIMQFAGEEYVPLWLAIAYLGSNIILNTLNIYWFGKMIETLRKRFQAPETEKSAEKPVVKRSTLANGAVRIDAGQTEVRRRKGVNSDEIPVPAI